MTAPCSGATGLRQIAGFRLDCRLRRIGVRRGVCRRFGGAAGGAAGSVGPICGAGSASTGSVLTVLMMLRWLARRACSTPDTLPPLPAALADEIAVVISGDKIA